MYAFLSYFLICSLRFFPSLVLYLYFFRLVSYPYIASLLGSLMDGWSLWRTWPNEAISRNMLMG